MTTKRERSFGISGLERKRTKGNKWSCIISYLWDFNNPEIKTHKIIYYKPYRKDVRIIKQVDLKTKQVKYTFNYLSILPNSNFCESSTLAELLQKMRSYPFNINI